MNFLVDGLDPLNLFNTMALGTHLEASPAGWSLLDRSARLLKAMAECVCSVCVRVCV